MSTGQAIFNNKQSKRDLIIILFCYYLRDVSEMAFKK